MNISIIHEHKGLRTVIIFILYTKFSLSRKTGKYMQISNFLLNFSNSELIQERTSLNFNHVLLKGQEKGLILKCNINLYNKMQTETKSAMILSGTDMEIAIENSNETGITAIKLKNIPVSFRELGLLPRGRWDALIELNLFSHRLTPATALGPKGCKILSRAAMPLIVWINLNCQAITAVGVTHLAKNPWPTLRDISLIRNRLSVGSGQALTKTNWRGLSYLNLEYNLLTDEDTKAMLSQGIKLRIDAQRNIIEDQDGKLEDAFDQRLFALILYNSFF